MDRTDQIWQSFFEQFRLSEKQKTQFLLYARLLQMHNQEINLTTLTTDQEIVRDHFQDSLALSLISDITFKHIADVGAGAGFPGIPLKIFYPDIQLTLIEVIGKKVNFLNQVITELNLTQTIVSDLDWRTFLRKTSYDIDLFCARASLPISELLRMFKPSCFYKNARLVYWASQHWQPNSVEKEYLLTEDFYQLNAKKRRLVFFASPR